MQVRGILLSLFSLLVFIVAAKTQSTSKLNASPQTTKKPDKIDDPFTKRVNKTKVADAYPFLSGDGLRLYFTSNREGGHGRFFLSTRKNCLEPFSEPKVLSRHLTDGYYAGTLTADELTLVMVKAGRMYLSTRNTQEDEFGKPVEIRGIENGFHYGPSISPDGNEIIVMGESKSTPVIRRYLKDGENEFHFDGYLPVPGGSRPGPGQLSKDGLSYYFSLANDSTQDVTIWRYSRTSTTTAFYNLEEMPLHINSLRRNFQPSVNNDGSIVAHVTSQNDLWEEDDIVLVSDPVKTLVATKQFTPVEINAGKDIAMEMNTTKPGIRAYPNPFQRNIILETAEMPTPGTFFTLFDVNGRVVTRVAITNKRTDISVSDVPAGIYIYQVVNAGKTLVSSGKLFRTN